MKTPKPFRIVFIDNNPVERALFKAIVEHMPVKINVHVYEKIDEIITDIPAMETPPDAVFIDNNMPRQTGIELLPHIREIGHLKNVPVIIYASDSLPQHVDEAFSAGAKYYIKKPQDFDKTQMIISWLVSHIHENAGRESFLLTEHQFPQTAADLK